MYRVAEQPVKDVDASAWDRFAQSAGASYQTAYASLARSPRRRSRLRLIIVTVIDDGGERRIAQGIVRRQNGSKVVFPYGLAIPSAEDARWADVMRAILTHLGPCTIVYGGGWSLEPARDESAAGLAGVTVLSRVGYVFHAVDFSRWDSFDGYWCKVSDSVRYEAKYAPERIPGFVVSQYSGREILRHLREIVALVNTSRQSKNLQRDVARKYVWYISKITFAPHLYEAAVARSHEGAEAVYSSAYFGGHTFYLSGGIRSRRGMANWHLLREMVRKAYERAPDGKFLMGRALDADVDTDAYDIGLVRARKALRASDFPSAEITFSYSGAA